MSSVLVHHRFPERVLKPNGQWSALREPRVGVMLHYDGSASDEGAMSWFGDPECEFSYQRLVLRSGEAVRIAPDDVAAWHAGNCRPSGDLEYRHANSAFYGVAIASSGHEGATYPQILTTAYLVGRYLQAHGWEPMREGRRITGHDMEAWPRGRKTDPTGPTPKHPILSVEGIRGLVPRLLLPRLGLAKPNRIVS